MSNLVHGSEGAAAPAGSASPDWRDHRKAGVLLGLAAAAVVGLVVLINVTHATPNPAASASSSMSGMPSGSTGTATTTGSTGTSTTSMGMSTPSGSMGSSMGATTASSGSVAIVTGGKATSSMPNTMSMTPLGQANWDGMDIEARATAPLPFILFNGTSQEVVNPTAKTSFHLMVALNDASTGYAIPYSSVWATITKAGKIVFDERLWPMVSRYMGPHYGDNVDLPAAGVYHLTLLVSPPMAARHIEYKGLWLTPHRVSMVFHWEPKT